MNSDNFQRIEDYLEGRLHESEVKDFENQLKTDQDLSYQLESYSNIVKEIQEFSRNELKNKLKKIHYEEIPIKEKKESNLTKKYFRSIAAVLALMILISPVIYTKFLKKSSRDKLFTEYFEPYINISSQRGASIDENNLLKESAMYYYEKRDYQKAILNFEELLLNESIRNNQILFYYGISCLGGEENLKAIEVLEDLNDHESSIFYEPSNWYLALAYLKTGEEEKSIELLNKLVKYKGCYSSKAGEIVDRL